MRAIVIARGGCELSGLQKVVKGRGTADAYGRAMRPRMSTALRCMADAPPSHARATTRDVAPKLMIRGLHDPEDLTLMADRAKEECVRLEWSFRDILLSLPSSSSSTSVPLDSDDIDNLNTMIKAFQCLMEMRLVTSNVIRPSRYIVDYSQQHMGNITSEKIQTSCRWSEVALLSLEQMGAILHGMGQDSQITSFLYLLRDTLQDIITANGSMSARFISLEDCSRARSWLRCCEVLQGIISPALSLPSSSPSSLSPSTTSDISNTKVSPEEATDGMTAPLELFGRKAAMAAFGILSNHPSFQPCLILHPLQAKALNEWLELNPPPPLPSSTDLTRLCARFGALELSHQPLPDGSYPPLKLSVRGLDESLAIDLSDLIDMTDMAKEALSASENKKDGKTAYQDLVVVRLTASVITSVLCNHPDEDLRQLVYESGLVKREKALLSVIRALGLYQDPYFLIRGSLFREEANVLSFLHDLESTLRPYAKIDVDDLREIQYRFLDKETSQGEKKSLDIDGWNIDYLMTQSMRMMSKGKRGFGNSWGEWQNHFSIKSVLIGINKVISHIMAVSFDHPSHGIRVQEDAWGLGGIAVILTIVDLSSLGSAAAGKDRLQGQQPIQSLRKVGTIVIHLHQSNEFPFTTLINEGHRLCPLPLPLAHDNNDDDVNDASDLPVAVIRISDPSTPSSSSSSSSSFSSLDEPLSSPFFIRALWHEMGHALHFLLSSTHSPTLNSHTHDHPTLSLPSPSRLNACHSSIDIRELPSHIFELLSRSPIVLQAMSCHTRLGTRLSERDAIRLALSPILSGLMASGYSTSFDLHESIVAAITDIEIQRVTEGSKKCGIHQVWNNVWEKHGTLNGSVATIERLRHLESMSVVGGGKWVYLLSRLLAASVMKRFRLKGGYGGGGEQGEEDQDIMSPEQWMVIRELLMHSGGNEDPSVVIRRLLGEDSLALAPNHQGWVVNLESKVFQDIDLLD